MTDHEWRYELRIFELHKFSSKIIFHLFMQTDKINCTATTAATKIMNMCIKMLLQVLTVAEVPLDKMH